MEYFNVSFHATNWTALICKFSAWGGRGAGCLKSFCKIHEEAAVNMLSNIRTWGLKSLKRDLPSEISSADVTPPSHNGRPNILTMAQCSAIKREPHTRTKKSALSHRPDRANPPFPKR
ncbi:hypothetical protein CDAR_412951 [Caerostris darwini]|uniref:Uncharacterized protein n=1 Tax=Caerostris darwini TaxID=1538125 RepID=A0AAV4PM81_9ARAC|nr:hypothetical protein CDAR_412951 [Caerostris darwini]